MVLNRLHPMTRKLPAVAVRWPSLNRINPRYIIKKSIESAYYRNAEMIVTPWPEWQYCRSKKLAAIVAK